MFHNVFIEMIVRSTASFMVLLLLARLLGRKQLSQLTFFNYITGITIGSIAADIAGESKTPFFEGLTSLIWWSFLTFLLGYLGLKSSKARIVIDGQPVIVIKDGKILEETLGKHHLNMDDLSMLLREKNVFSLSEVSTAIFEPDGKLTVTLKPGHRPLTKRDQNVFTGNPKYIPTELIVGGNILDQNLKEAGLSEEWLRHQLNHFQINVKDAFYVELQENGTLYIDRRDDGITE